MTYQKCGTGEYQLMKEEYLHECLPSDLGYSQDKSGRRSPAIIFRQPLKDKESLKFRDVESGWAVAQHHNRIELIFLTTMFKATSSLLSAQIRVCIDHFSPDVMDWFRLLVSTNGEMALSDSLGDVEGIRISGIPLDVPIAMLAQVKTPS